MIAARTCTTSSCITTLPLRVQEHLGRCQVQKNYIRPDIINELLSSLLTFRRREKLYSIIPLENMSSKKCHVTWTAILANILIEMFGNVRI